MNKPIQKSDFLFELGCEELPPKALKKLAQALHNNISEALKSVDLSFNSSEWFATPRRLAVRINQLDVAQADKQIEKLGPAIAAAYDSEEKPKPAAIGFAKSNGVDISQLSTKQTDKGERLAFIAQAKGKQTSLLMQDILTKAVSQLPVPKMMRWGSSNIQFSRPIHWVVALLGNEVLPVKILGLTADKITFGHRFHAPQAITLESPKNYESVLNSAKVIVNFNQREAIIRSQIETLAKNCNATAVMSSSLLEEVTSLVEFPVALLGEFDRLFLDVPAEALISSMVEHQKYFHLVDDSGKLLPNFITIANIQSINPESIIHGNEKVIRPRLSDAKFFFYNDCKQPLSSHTEKLKSVLFHKKLGTIFDRVERIKRLSEVIAHKLNIDQKLVSRAATLCKCDLMTDMVNEFSDLQGIMGRYYAEKDSEPTEVAAAMDEIYMPRFAGDQLPKTDTGLVLAIAERIDLLVGIFGIGQIPTGAKDPFALRRASLGVLRLIVEKGLPLDLALLIDESIATYSNVELLDDTKEKLLNYFSARALASYQDLGFSTQSINAVQELNITLPLDFKNRVEAVESFTKTQACESLAEANKRVKNILQKSDFDPTSITIDESLFQTEEKLFYETMSQVENAVARYIEKGNYQSALESLAKLKEVVNNFFDHVMINVDDPSIRNNRLALISKLRNLFLGIADISLLQK